MHWTIDSPREQKPLKQEPYDRWVTPEGVCMAEFRRVSSGYSIRFPGQADFLIEIGDDPARPVVTGWPALDCDETTTDNLFHNAIQPILGNHGGGLFLHGSAVSIGIPAGSEQSSGAVAFLGLSRDGKTTLAGSFAKSGFPFLTEDVIDLRLQHGDYWLQPKRSKLRLFADSAKHLLGEQNEFEDDNLKQDVDAGTKLPFSDQAIPLRQIYILGTDHRAKLSVKPMASSDALTSLLPHAFILDVEDRVRLKAHFDRMADLSQDIECYTLDFTRDYEELPRVREAILECFSGVAAQR